MTSATRRLHLERHRGERIGWLRAAVLGANDGIVSTASLVVGVAAAQASPSAIVMTAVAGLVAITPAAGNVGIPITIQITDGRPRVDPGPDVMPLPWLARVLRNPIPAKVVLVGHGDNIAATITGEIGSHEVVN